MQQLHQLSLQWNQQQTQRAGQIDNHLQAKQAENAHQSTN